MRIIVDASIDPRFVEAFPNDDVQTLFDLGWQSLKDHILVRRLECDVFVTADKGFEHQHNLKSLPFGIVVLHAERNKVSFYRPMYPELLNAISSVKPGTVMHVPAN